MGTDDEERGDRADAGQRGDTVDARGLFEPALGVLFFGQRHPLCFLRGFPPSRLRGLADDRSGCRLISTPEIRVCSRRFSVDLRQLGRQFHQ